MPKDDQKPPADLPPRLRALTPGVDATNGGFAPPEPSTVAGQMLRQAVVGLSLPEDVMHAYELGLISEQECKRRLGLHADAVAPRAYEPLADVAEPTLDAAGPQEATWGVMALVGVGCFCAIIGAAQLLSWMVDAFGGGL